MNVSETKNETGLCGLSSLICIIHGNDYDGNRQHGLFRIGRRVFNNLRYTYDIVVISEYEE